MSRRMPDFDTFMYRGQTSYTPPRTIDKQDIDRTLRGREKLNVCVDPVQELPVFKTTPQNPIDSDTIIIRATAFTDDNARPESALIDAYVAEATGFRVIAVNPPGVDYFNNDAASESRCQLTPEQHEDLKYKGSFRKVGEASMRAVMIASPSPSPSPRFIMSASSMGVALSAGMLHEAMVHDGVHVAGVVLAEPVNYYERPFPNLVAQFVKSSSTAPSYARLNPDRLIGETESLLFWVKRVVHSRRANFRYANALGKGAFFRDLGEGLDALADHHVPLYLTAGTASRLSGTEQEFQEQFAEKFSEDRRRVDHFQGHDHPYTMTIQSVIDGVSQVSL